MQNQSPKVSEQDTVSTRTLRDNVAVVTVPPDDISRAADIVIGKKPENVLSLVSCVVNI